MEVNSIEAGRACGGADVAAVRGEKLFEVAALDVANPAAAHGAQRLVDVDRRLVGVVGRERRLLACERAVADIVSPSDSRIASTARSDGQVAPTCP